MTNPSPKNTFYIKSPSEDWINLSQHAFDEYQWKPVLWVGMKKSASILYDNNSHHADYYIQEDAMLAIAPSLPEHHQWKAIDAEILKDLSYHQPIVQEMLNRWFINIEKASFKSRMQYYNKLVEIWLNIFEAYKIDLVICPTVPHRIFDYIAYMIAQYKNIPYLMIDATAGIHNRDGSLVECFFVIDKIDNRTDQITKEFEKQKPKLFLTKNTEDYIKKVQSTYAAAKPKYLSDKEKISNNLPIGQIIKSYIPLSIKAWIKALFRIATNANVKKSSKIKFNDYFSEERSLVFNPSILSADLFNAKVKQVTQKAFNWYNHNAEELKTNSPYILFTASKQPERSTCPDAGHFYNHFDIIKTLIEVLPSNYLIYFKEHPSNFRKPWVMDGQRSQSYYENLKNIAPDRIKFLKFETNPFKAIDSATAVVSATGSSCWEAIIRRKPAIIFGSNWYENCSGIYKFISIDDLKRNFELIEKGVTPDIQEIGCYIEFMYQLNDDVYWRHDLHFGAKNNNPKNPDYRERLNLFAQAYHNGLKRFEHSQTRD